MSGWLVLNLVRTQDGYGNEGDRAETGDQLSDEDESDEDEITHAVPFKCIGAAHEKNYQHHSEKACLALHGQDKPVCICHACTLVQLPQNSNIVFLLWHKFISRTPIWLSLPIS